MPKIKYVINFMMLNTIFLLYCMKLSHINHDEKIYTAVFLNFILTSRIKDLVCDQDAIKPLYLDIIRQFCNKFNQNDKIVLIVDSNNNELDIENQIPETHDKNIILYSNEDCFSLDCIQNVDYFVTTREAISSKYVDYGDLYDVKILSGLEYDIFSNI